MAPNIFISCGSLECNPRHIIPGKTTERHDVQGQGKVMWDLKQSRQSPSLSKHWAKIFKPHSITYSRIRSYCVVSLNLWAMLPLIKHGRLDNLFNSMQELEYVLSRTYKKCKEEKIRPINLFLTRPPAAAPVRRSPKQRKFDNTVS